MKYSAGIIYNLTTKDAEAFAEKHRELPVYYIVSGLLFFNLTIYH
jgi:hypothetical protein